MYGCLHPYKNCKTATVILSGATFSQAFSMDFLKDWKLPDCLIYFYESCSLFILWKTHTIKKALNNSDRKVSWLAWRSEVLLLQVFWFVWLKKDGAFYVMNIHPSSSIFILPSRSQLPQSRSLSTPWTVLTGTSVTVTSMLFQSVDGEITFTAQNHSGWHVFCHILFSSQEIAQPASQVVSFYQSCRRFKDAHNDSKAVSHSQIIKNACLILLCIRS